MAIDSYSGQGAEPVLAAPQLELLGESVGARYTLALVGELDMASAPALEAALRRICTDQTEAVELDLSSLTFMDSTGLRVMLIAKDLCDQHGCEFQLVRGPAQVQRLFEVTGLIEQLPLRD